MRIFRQTLTTLAGWRVQTARRLTGANITLCWLLNYSEWRNPLQTRSAFLHTHSSPSLHTKRATRFWRCTTGQNRHENIHTKWTCAYGNRATRGEHKQPPPTTTSPVVQQRQQQQRPPPSFQEHQLNVRQHTEHTEQPTAPGDYGGF